MGYSTKTYICLNEGVANEVTSDYNYWVGDPYPDVNVIGIIEAILDDGKLSQQKYYMVFVFII